MPTWIFQACLALGLALTGAGPGLAQDRITQKDGKVVEGAILEEDATAVFVRLPNGENRGILKNRIENVERGVVAAPGPASKGVPAPGEPGEPREPLEGAGPAALPRQPDHPAEVAGGALAQRDRENFEQLKALGDPSKPKREQAMAKTKELGFQATPVLIASLNTKAVETDPYYRMGALRALVELGPLDDQGAQTLAWVAVKDPDGEVRREACRSIRRLHDDRALNQLIQWAAQDKVGAVQFSAAVALREINDDRAFAALAAAIPAPEVTASPTGGTSRVVQELELPIGPGGTPLPVQLTETPVIGQAQNISSPPAGALKMIARKDLGSLQATWLNWLREKAGIYSREEWEAERSRARGSLTGKTGLGPTVRE